MSQQFFDKSPYPICLIEFDGSIKKLNSAFESIFEISRKDIKKLQDSILIDDRKIALSALKSICAANPTATFESRGNSSSSTNRWFRWNLSLDNDLIQATAFEVTDYIKKYKEISQEKDIYQTLIDDHSAYVTCFTPGYVLTYVNSSYAHFFNKSPEELIGTCFLDYVTLKEKEELQKYFEKFTPENNILNFKNSTTTDDRITHQLWRNRAFFDQFGKIESFQATGIDITALKNTEQELLKSQERLESALGISTTGVWDWNLTTGEVYDTSNLFGMLGYQENEFEKTVESMQNLIHPEDRAKVETDLEAHINGITTYYENEHRLLQKSGDWKWVLSRGKIVEYDSTGTPLRILGCKTDINSLKKSHDKLQQFNTLLEAIKLAQELINTKSRKHIFKHILTYIICLTKSEHGFIGECSFDENEKEKIEIFEINKANDTDKKHVSKSLKTLLELTRKSKETVIINNSNFSEIENFLGAPVYSKVEHFLGIPIYTNDTLVGLVGIANKEGGYDEKTINFLQPLMSIISNFMQACATETLREQAEETLRLFVQQTPAAVAMFDTEMRYLITSDCWLEDYKLKNKNIIGKKYYDISAHKIPEHWPLIHKNCLQGAVVESREDELENSEGNTEWVKWEAHPWYKGKKVEGIIVFSELITKRKRAEKKMERMVKNLQRSNSELERFAYICSHDLKEPLRAISSFVQLIAKHNPSSLDDEAKQYIDLAVSNVKRMQRLIDDILVYSKTESHKTNTRLVDVNNVIEDVKKILFFSVEENTAKIYTNQLPSLYTDKTQITQLFQNLINNAIKFRGENPPEIHIEAIEKSKYWEFFVKDNGIGIEPIYHKKIFTMFQRLNRRDDKSGSGIGLALCKKIVEHLGGYIWVESDINKGSTFCFTLPKKNP